MLTLVQSSVIPVNQPNQQQGYLVNFTASVSSGDPFPSKIFVYQAGSLSGPSQGDLFQCVASMMTLDEYPADAPFAGDDTHPAIPFYRSAVLNFIAHSPDEATCLINIIQEDVADLVNNWNANKTLTQVTTTVFST